MGLNIYLTKPSTLSEHPRWDSSKLAGDRDFGELIGSLPAAVNYVNEEHYFRPLDFAAWREEIAKHEWPNPGRFELMCDLLDADPELWIYLSY